MRLPIGLLAHIATAHRRNLDLTAITGASSNASSIAATALQNFTAVVQTHSSDRGVLSRAGLGIPGKLQRLALILAVFGGPLRAVEAKNMPIAFAAPGLLRNALSGSGRLNAMEAAGPGSGIPDPSMTYLRWLDEMGEMGEAELKESRDVDAEKLEDIIKDIQAELKESRDVDAQELKDIIKDIGVEAQKIKNIKDFEDFAARLI